MPRLPPLTVGVRHGSLEHAPYRLLLGHFQGLPLTSAEARLNERSDGRLERLVLMNLYPQRLGEMAMLEPVDEAPPQGAVILGLGPAGELTAAQLRGLVTRGPCPDRAERARSSSGRRHWRHALRRGRWAFWPS